MASNKMTLARLTLVQRLYNISGDGLRQGSFSWNSPLRSAVKEYHKDGNKLLHFDKSAKQRWMWYMYNGYNRQMLSSNVQIISYRCYNHRSHGEGNSSRVWLGVVGGILMALGVVYKASRDTQKAQEKTSTNSIETESFVKSENIPSENSNKEISLSEAIEISKDILQRIKDETGSPGMVVAVSVNGNTVWSQGFGYADVENRVPCTPECVLRIASISKPITMAAVARLIESGDLDIDKPVQYYVPSFPEKTWNGEKVTITTRHLVSHLSGIRHYDKTYMNKTNDDGKQTGKDESPKSNQLELSKSRNKDNQSTSVSNMKKPNNQSSQVGPTQSSQGKSKQSSQVGSTVDEMELDEYYIQKHFNTVDESLNLFKNDPLVHKPGTKFLYTTHGYTLLSAVVEGVTKTPFDKHLKSMLKDLGMDSTYLDENDPIIYHRGRNYKKNKKGRLINTPYADLSYKWAGGGLLSSVHDVLKFGNIMLYSYQATSYHGDQGKRENIDSKQGSRSSLPGYLKPETMKMMFTPVDRADVKSSTTGEQYGMGWSVWTKKQIYGCCREQRFFVSHTGGALGASSVLLILPHENEKLDINGNNSMDIQDRTIGGSPKGIVVAILANMTSVGLNRTALEIAQVFEKVKKG